MTELSEIHQSPEKIYETQLTLILVAGVSAVGKTTLSGFACDMLKEIGVKAKRPVAYTTRERRENEVDGVDYKFVNQDVFETLFLSCFKDHPEDWDVDIISGNWYFNRLSETAPDRHCPVSILPVSLESCQHMAQKYSEKYPNIRIKIITIKVRDDRAACWRERMNACRANRDVDREYSLNETCRATENFDEDILFPEWDLNSDKIKFMELVLKTILKK